MSVSLYSLVLEAMIVLGLWLCMAVLQQDPNATGRRTFLCATLAWMGWCLGELAGQRGWLPDLAPPLGLLGALLLPPLWFGVAAQTMGIKLSALFAAGAAFGQVTTATLYGTVTDPTGAVIPGARFTLTNNGTGASQTKTADAAGEVGFTFLSVGTYNIRIEASGFKVYQARELQLSAAQNVRRSFVVSIANTGTG